MPYARKRLLVVSLLALAGCSGAGTEPTAVGEAPLADVADDGDGAAEGSFSCDFGLSSDLPLGTVPAVIERDRMYMAARPGMITKQLPIAFDPGTGAIYSGGRYLFDTYEHARDYAEWVRHGFFLDGVEFLSRPIFLAPDCHAWRVVGARSFAGIEHQVVMRTERFQVPAGSWGDLHRVFREARKEAEGRGLAALWLVANEDEGLAQLVYFRDRVGAVDPTVPDFASYGALAGAPALGDAVAPAGWVRTFDRTHWMLTVWFPFVAGDQGEASLWPSSPPFPAPYCGDGVCEPSRGETGGSCAADCAPGCGDAVCDPGEDTHGCPSDCRL
jgi:hypothetical protein